MIIKIGWGLIALYAWAVFDTAPAIGIITLASFGAIYLFDTKLENAKTKKEAAIWLLGPAFAFYAIFAAVVGWVIWTGDMRW